MTKCCLIGCPGGCVIIVPLFFSSVEATICVRPVNHVFQLLFIYVFRIIFIIFIPLPPLLRVLCWIQCRLKGGSQRGILNRGLDSLIVVIQPTRMRCLNKSFSSACCAERRFFLVDCFPRLISYLVTFVPPLQILPGPELQYVIESCFVVLERLLGYPYFLPIFIYCVGVLVGIVVEFLLSDDTGVCSTSTRNCTSGI